VEETRGGVLQILPIKGPEIRPLLYLSPASVKNIEYCFKIIGDTGVGHLFCTPSIILLRISFGGRSRLWNSSSSTATARQLGDAYCSASIAGRASFELAFPITARASQFGDTDCAITMAYWAGFVCQPYHPFQGKLDCLLDSAEEQRSRFGYAPSYSPATASVALRKACIAVLAEPPPGVQLDGRSGMSVLLPQPFQTVTICGCF
jgi:hypothetical protein